mgnify:CR=1 FL=1
MSNKIKHYYTEDITVVWNPELCHHAAECVKGLPEVFKPKERPWINPDCCTSEALKSTISKCPSGALSYSKGSELNTNTIKNENMSEEIKEIENQIKGIDKALIDSASTRMTLLSA